VKSGSVGVGAGLVDKIDDSASAKPIEAEIIKAFPQNLLSAATK
jgi:hypothetical protein